MFRPKEPSSLVCFGYVAWHLVFEALVFFFVFFAWFFWGVGWFWLFWPFSIGVSCLFCDVFGVLLLVFMFTFLSRILVER